MCSIHLGASAILTTTTRCSAACRIIIDNDKSKIMQKYIRPTNKRLEASSQRGRNYWANETVKMKSVKLPNERSKLTKNHSYFNGKAWKNGKKVRFECEKNSNVIQLTGTFSSTCLVDVNVSKCWSFVRASRHEFTYLRLHLSIWIFGCVCVYLYIVFKCRNHFFVFFFLVLEVLMEIRSNNIMSVE